MVVYKEFKPICYKLGNSWFVLFNKGMVCSQLHEFDTFVAVFYECQK